jgi:transposase-like protein
MRARIVLSCGQGMSNAEVAGKLHITGATVGKWRERFREFGLDGLLDESRVGAPRKITDQQVEDVIMGPESHSRQKLHRQRRGAHGWKVEPPASRHPGGTQARRLEYKATTMLIVGLASMVATVICIPRSLWASRSGCR